MASFDYQLLDFGRGRKLERFGAVVTDRPEVAATGHPRLTADEWRRTADAVFEPTRGQAGHWRWKSPAPSPWTIDFSAHGVRWRALLKPGKFKHVGIFPEQVAHWEWIAARTRKGMRVLNLFAYTGAASLTAALAGADVYHVDAARSAVNAAAENARLNDVSSIHWVVDDALTFAEREARRGRGYDLIIMDPPVFGKGTKGQNRKLKDQMGDLVALAARLLTPRGFLLLNTYSPQTDVAKMVNTCENAGLVPRDSGELEVHDPKGNRLTLSRFVRAQQSAKR